MNICIPSEIADMVREASAVSIWGALPRLISARDTSAASIRTAVMAARGISWNRAAITTLSSNGIGDFIALLRRSSFPIKEYTRVGEVIKGIYSASADCTAGFREWYRVAGRLRLELSIGCCAILAMAVSLQSQGIPTPSHMGVPPRLNYGR